MPKPQILAAQYANSIKAASFVTIQKSGIKLASHQPNLQATVRSVLNDIDRLVYETTRKPVTEEYKESLYELIDTALGVRPGTMGMVKKGSISSALAFADALEQLLMQVTFE